MVTPYCISFGWAGENREVELLVKDGVWMTAHYIDGQPDQQLIKTYGSHELPTPWSDAVPRSTVVQDFTARNPHIKIH